MLALMLKFRELFSDDWHKRIRIKCRYDSRITDQIKNHLGEVRRRDIRNEIGGYLSDLDEDVNALPENNCDFDCEISMLEVVERIQLFVWDRGKGPNKSFVDEYAAIRSISSVNQFIELWVSWEQSGLEIVRHFLSENANFSYTLKEFERSLGNNYHFCIPVNDISQLEHIFAQNIDENSAFGGFSTIGFKDKIDYQNNFLNHSGNQTILSAALNESLGNKMPYLQKADAYKTASHVKISEKVGHSISRTPAIMAQCWLLEARCAEIALFALKRFFPK